MPDGIVELEKVWVPIKEAIISCNWCVNFSQCEIIAKHIATATRGEFTFRCPVLGIAVEDLKSEASESQEGHSDEGDGVRASKSCIVPSKWGSENTANLPPTNESANKWNPQKRTNSLKN